MKRIILCVLVVLSINAKAQKAFETENTRAIYNQIFDAKTMQKPPVYPFGMDSCKRFYFANFDGMDSVLTKAVRNGDTATFIRVYFSFVVDTKGTAYDGRFERIASTASYKTKDAKTIKYFNEDKKYYDKLIKQMVSKMTIWKPGLYDEVRVEAKIDDFIQFWVGINPPQN
jgi:hypothetical protein